MELTKSELEIAERCLSQRERQLEQWPRRRWLILAMFSVFALVGYLIARDGKRSIDDDKAMDMQVSQALEKPPPLGLEHHWAVGAMMKISKILELRHQVVSAALMQVAIGYVQLLGGVAIVCVTILRWKPSEREALICKLLRRKLQELERGASQNGGPAELSGSSGAGGGPPSVS